MKDTITQQLDDKDIECVNILKKTGFGSCAAKTVVALVSGEKTQHELAGCTGENQSAVSVVLKDLIAANYVNVSAVLHTQEKGRPKRMYILKSWDVVVDMIEKNSIRENADKLAMINRLKELTN